MRTILVISLLLPLTLTACGGGGRRSLNPCTLVDASLAESLVGDRTGEPGPTSSDKTHDYVACHWTGQGESLTVEAKIYDNTRTAEADFYRAAQTWECHTTLTTPKKTRSCAYKSPLDTGVILTKGQITARIAYKGPDTTAGDPTTAQQLTTKALSAL